jgi:predicted metal-binding membrane protein
MKAWSRPAEAKMSETSVFEIALKRDRLIVIAGLVTVIALSWIYILLGAGMQMTAREMTAMTMSQRDTTDMDMEVPQRGGMSSAKGKSETMPMGKAAMLKPVAWTPNYAILMIVMWWVMMVAMMLPSAAPMVLLFALVNRKQRTQGAPFVSTGVFAAGYIVAWGGFSVLAASLQWGLERAALLSTMMASTSALFGGILLIAAGIYQLTPLKQACLKHCRGPVQFITHHWRPGSFGAFRMGLEHGLFCLGCCWFLMGLLFVGGVMNLYWIVGLAIFVLLEKTIPAGHWLGWLTGVGLIVWGGLVLAMAV